MVGDNNPTPAPGPAPAPENGNNQVQRVSIKFLPFWADDPETWFQQLEAQFVLAGITVDTTKFYHLLTALDTKLLSQVSDAVKKPPDDEKYENLKRAMLSQFAVSEQRKFKTLLEDIQLGDKKPSHLLNEMRNLGGEKVGTEFLKQMWLQRLPTQIRMMCQAIPQADINDVAKMADLLIETSDRSQIACASTSQSSTSSYVSSLERQVMELTKRIEQIEYRSRSKSRSRSCSKNARSATPRPQYNCYYHDRFGEKAKKCRSGCTFSKNS